jgi:putative spermidine/putrescine transport system substrate-binding protein
MRVGHRRQQSAGALEKKETLVIDDDVVLEEDGRLSRRDLLVRAAAGSVGIAGLSAGANLLGASSVFASESTDARISMNSLVTNAKKEGHLNVITLPRDWADYGEIMDTFHAKYGLSITDAIPLGSSAQEIAAIQSLKGQSRAPDVVDVSPAKAIEGTQAGLFIPYKVATWSSIPSNMKDPKGRWYGDYWGVTSFISLDSQVKNAPKDWADLLKPEYKNQVALGGDPTQAGEAFGAVFGAALANGGSLDNIAPGIDFFAKIKAAGNWNPTLGNSVANLSKGVTPIVIRWDYLNLAMRDEVKKGGQAATVNIPHTGRYGGYYCQAISKYAPHTNAAKLWQEFLYSDAGQLFFLKGYTHPARYNDLVKRGKVPKSLAARLPAASNYKGVKFATVDQINAAQNVLSAQWHQKMG